MKNYNNLLPKFCIEKFMPVALLNLTKIILSMVLTKTSNNCIFHFTSIIAMNCFCAVETFALSKLFLRIWVQSISVIRSCDRIYQ